MDKNKLAEERVERLNQMIWHDKLIGGRYDK